MERSSFDIFKSNICHLVKDKGELSFIRDMLCSDEVSKLYERKWYAECLYLLAMIDYLSRKNDIPLYNGYNNGQARQSALSLGNNGNVQSFGRRKHIDKKF